MEYCLVTCTPGKLSLVCIVPFSQFVRIRIRGRVYHTGYTCMRIGILVEIQSQSDDSNKWIYFSRRNSRSITRLESYRFGELCRLCRKHPEYPPWAGDIEVLPVRGKIQHHRHDTARAGLLGESETGRQADSCLFNRWGDRWQSHQHYADRRVAAFRPG